MNFSKFTYTCGPGEGSWDVTLRDPYSGSSTSISKGPLGGLLSYSFDYTQWHLWWDGPSSLMSPCWRTTSPFWRFSGPIPLSSYLCGSRPSPFIVSLSFHILSYLKVFNLCNYIGGEWLFDLWRLWSLPESIWRGSYRRGIHWR